MEAVECKKLLKEIRETLQNGRENFDNNHEIFLGFCRQLGKLSQQEKLEFRYQPSGTCYQLSIGCSGRHREISIHIGDDGFYLNGKKIELKNPEDILKLLVSPLSFKI